MLPSFYLFLYCYSLKNSKRTFELLSTSKIRSADEGAITLNLSNQGKNDKFLSILPLLVMDTFLWCVNYIRIYYTSITKTDVVRNYQYVICSMNLIYWY